MTSECECARCETWKTSCCCVSLLMLLLLMLFVVVVIVMVVVVAVPILAKINTLKITTGECECERKRDREYKKSNLSAYNIVVSCFCC